DPVTRLRELTVPKESYRIPLKQENIDVVKNAMVGVTKEGTASRIFNKAEYTSGGKTGTAQAIGMKKDEKYNAAKLEERFRDHSLYVAFAPADKPRIAIAIIVENAGFGSAAAAPIARKAFDYYLLGQMGDLQAILAKYPGVTPAPQKPAPKPAAPVAAAAVVAPPPKPVVPAAPPSTPALSLRPEPSGDVGQAPARPVTTISKEEEQP